MTMTIRPAEIGDKCDLPRISEKVICADGTFYAGEECGVPAKARIGNRSALCARHLKEYARRVERGEL